MTTATYAPANQNVPANPQLAPYGFFGDLARTFMPAAGQAIGSVFGNQQLGGQLGNTLGGLAGLMPFGAQPGMPGQYQQPQQAAQVQAALAQAVLAQQQQQLAPYGFFGDLVRSVAPTGGQIIGGLLGDQQTGGQVGGILGQLGGLLPFGAQPGVPQTQLHPQQAQQIQQAIQAQQQAQQVQQAIQAQQQAQQVQQAIQAQQIQHAIQAQQQAQQVQQQAQQAMQAQQIQRALAQQSGQLAPYGFLGGALGNVLGGLGGSALGGLFGDSTMGGSIGSTAGSILGGILPFQAQPGMSGSPWTSYQGMSDNRQPMSN
jgi:hypothetical protein